MLHESKKFTWRHWKNCVTVITEELCNNLASSSCLEMYMIGTPATFQSLLLSSECLLSSSRQVVSDSLQPHGLQHASLPCPWLSPRVCSDSCPLSLWCYLTISSFVVPSPFAFSLSQHQGFFQWVGSSRQVAKVLELQQQPLQWMFRVDVL